MSVAAVWRNGMGRLITGDKSTRGSLAGRGFACVTGMHRVMLQMLLFALMLAALHPAYAQNVRQRQLAPEVETFVARVSSEHGFDALQLREMFIDLKPNETIIKAFNAPATSRPWHYFRGLYVTDLRINGGVTFWNDNAQWLEKARATYGVPEEIITAIIGVETIYGQYTGQFRVVEALYTLGFEVPRRSQFFQREFEQFLLLARENSLDPLEVKGSFAGAMGISQFISSSYRQYAIDFDGDGRVDLWNSTADAIGSVANYLSRFGWKDGQQVVLPVTSVSPEQATLLEAYGVKPVLSMAELRAHGVTTDGDLGNGVNGGFFSLENESGQEYWVSLNNFYVITRYNRSKNYAMAVYQLAQEIAKKRREQQGSVATRGE